MSQKWLEIVLKYVIKVDIEDSSLRLQYRRYDTVLLIKEYWKISTVTTEWEKSLSKDCDVG